MAGKSVDIYIHLWAFQVAPVVKNLSAYAEDKKCGFNSSVGKIP